MPASATHASVWPQCRCLDPLCPNSEQCHSVRLFTTEAHGNFRIFPCLAIQAVVIWGGSCQSLQTPCCSSCFMGFLMLPLGAPQSGVLLGFQAELGHKPLFFLPPPPKPSLLREGQVGRSGTCSGTGKHLGLDRVLCRTLHAPWASLGPTCVSV